MGRLLVTVLLLAAAHPALGAERPRHVRYVILGGGATPESTEVSLEQDVLLAAEVLHGPGAVLFAGGASALSVRTSEPALTGEQLVVELGDFFAPRAGRGSRYRAPRSPGALAADKDQVESQLRLALADGSDPLLVYVAAHGDRGETARDNQVVLWGGQGLTVASLDALTARTRRPLRVVMASCYSGGFAELAFEGADPRRGATKTPRCGLFAGTWDRETSGCDPNPDRRAQEGYSLHFLHALRGQDREGRTLPEREIDVDGDGAISLLEAHTRARIASRSIDVPTTTSERYLREVQRRGSPKLQHVVPEEAAVIARLGPQLGLLAEADVRARWQALQTRLDDLDARLDVAEATEADARARLTGHLLGRWPMLDDAYHPDFARTTADHAPSIEKALRHGSDATAYHSAADHVAKLDDRFLAAQAEEAVVTRLLRAYETLHLATALAARGGAPWKQYQALLKCERGRP